MLTYKKYCKIIITCIFIKQILKNYTTWYNVKKKSMIFLNTLLENDYFALQSSLTNSVGVIWSHGHWVERAIIPFAPLENFQCGFL